MPLPLWLYSRLPFGRRSEIDAAAYLRSVGYRVVATGYRTRAGEIDLIGWDGNALAFVEVKALHSGAPPEDRVNYGKQLRIIRTARSYLARYRLQESPYRFDILAVSAQPGRPPEFRLLKDAFRDRRER